MSQTRPYKPTEIERVRVELMRMCGMDRESIAHHLGMSIGTLDKHFKRELSEGGNFATYKVASELFKNAMKGNVQAQMFWMRTQGRWADRLDAARALSDGRVQYQVATGIERAPNQPRIIDVEPEVVDGGD